MATRANDAVGFWGAGVRAENHAAEPKGRHSSYCAKVGDGTTVDDDRASMLGGERQTRCDGSNAILEELESAPGAGLSAIGRERKTTLPSPNGKG